MSQTAKELERLNQEYESILSRKEQVSKKKEERLLELKNTKTSLLEQRDALVLACAKLQELTKTAIEQAKNSENKDNDKNDNEQDFTALRAAQKNLGELEANLVASRHWCDWDERRVAELAAQEAELERMCEALAARLKEVASKS